MRISTYKLVWYTYFLTAIVSFTRITDYFSLRASLRYIQILLIAFLLFVRFQHDGKIRARNLGFIVLVSCIAIIDFAYVKDMSVLFYITFAAFAMVDSTESFLKTDFRIRSGFALLVIGLCLLGVLTDYTMLREDGSVRHALGFSHPNILGCFASVILLEYCSLHSDEKFKPRYLMTVLLGLLLIDQITNSRTYMLSILLVLLIFLIIRKNGLNKRVTRIGLIVLPAILTVISFALVFLYKPGNPVWEELNVLLSHRISNGQAFVQGYDLKGLGQSIDLVGSVHAMLTAGQTHILDMGYIRFVLEYGVIFWGILMLILGSCMNYAIKKRHYNEILLLLYLMISAIFEATFTNPIVNFVIPVIVASAVSSNKRRKREAVNV